MLRVTVRGSDMPAVVLGSGETLLIGRAPRVPDDRPDTQLRVTAYPLPDSAAYVSRLLGEVVVGEETVLLRWHGATEAQLSSMLDAPAGARRVVLTENMSAQLDEGENQLLVLRGRQVGTEHADRLLTVDVVRADTAATRPIPLPALLDQEAAPTKDAPGLVPHGREWFVALALAEPWLTGADDYPRPADQPRDLRTGARLARLRVEPRTGPTGRRRDPQGRRGGVRPARRPVPRRAGPTGTQRAVRRRSPRRGGATGHRGGPERGHSCGRGTPARLVTQGTSRRRRP